MAEHAMLRDEDVAACRAVLRANSRTFHAASLLLPRRWGGGQSKRRCVA